MMIELKDLEYIGKFGKTHGYKGEINLGFSQFENDKYLKEGCPLIVEIDGTLIPYFIKDFRSRGMDYKWLVTIAKYDGNSLNISEVSVLENREVYGPRDEVMEMYPDFIPETEMNLEGYMLTDKDYGPVGKILSFDDSTENILIEVELEDGRVVTLPMDFDFIIQASEEPLEIETVYPPGLLESLLDPAFETDIPDNDE